jgi:hypothetical protein
VQRERPSRLICLFMVAALAAQLYSSTGAAFFATRTHAKTLCALASLAAFVLLDRREIYMPLSVRGHLHRYRICRTRARRFAGALLLSAAFLVHLAGARASTHFSPFVGPRSFRILPLTDAQTATRTVLIDAADKWIEVAERIRSSGGVIVGALPADLTTSRAAFEQAWYNAGLQERRAAGYQKLGKAFSLLIRSYRFQERGNPDPRLAQTWSDEMISFYRQVASRRELTEAMLEKGAIYLEASQLQQTDKVQFERISRDGDRLLQECMSIAEDDQKTEILRYWSRFYYNLARPASGRLSDRWDDRFLMLADERIGEALKREPELLKNLNQKARVTQRRARNTLEAPSEQWSDALWNVQRAFAHAWKKADPAIQRAEDRISPLNVLAMVTLDAVMYTLVVSDENGKKIAARHLLPILDDAGLKPQLNAWALVRNTELSRPYGFDTAYDLARVYALRGTIRGTQETGRQNEDIDAVALYLKEARDLATVLQIDAAKASLSGDPVFASLPEYARQRLSRVLNGEGG